MGVEQSVAAGRASSAPLASPTLPELSAVELRRLIGTREISPVELLEACIERIERLNPFVNAVTATCFDRARDEARAAERAVLRGEPLGLLHGLPLGVKDLEPTAGLLSTQGTPSLRNHVPAQDIELVARLRRAGAIVTAKTNVPEMGAGANSRNPVWGATGNPFNPNQTRQITPQRPMPGKSKLRPTFGATRPSSSDCASPE